MGIFDLFKKKKAVLELPCQFDFDYDRLPDEESVMDISRAWGVDTSFPGVYEKGVGFLCKR